MLCLFCLTNVMVAPVHATSVQTKPVKPSIISIVAVSRGRRIDVTVKFTQSSLPLRSPILSTQVRVGGAFCIAFGRSTSCKAKGLALSRIVKVQARSRNRNGYGPWSSAIFFRTNGGEVWRRMTSAPSTSIVSPPSPSSTMPTTTTSAPPTGGAAAAELRFDFEGAVGLALKPVVTSSGVSKSSVGSNLQKLDGSGKMTDSLVSGQATISRFLIAPNDKLYVVFSSRPVIGGKTCLLAEISRITGAPNCVESDPDFQFVPPGQSKNKFTSGTSFRNLINDFQFDNSGAIYYLGTPGTKSSFPSLRCCSTFFGDTPSVGSVVRKYLDGKVTDYGVSYFEPGKQNEPGFTDSMATSLMLRRSISNFLVLSDGKVLTDQNLDFVRDSQGGFCTYHRLDIWSPDGTHRPVKDLVSNYRPVDTRNCDAVFLASASGDQDAQFGEAYNFLQMLGGSTVVAGLGGVVNKVDTTDARAAGLPFSRTDWCSSQQLLSLFDFDHYFCGDGTMWRSAWRVPNGDVYAIVGQDPGWPSLFGNPEYEKVGVRYGSGVLVKVWPTLGVTPIGYDSPVAVLNRVESFLPILDSVVASGTTTDGRVQTVLFDTSTGKAEVLIQPSSDLHPLKFAFNAGANKVLFSTSGSLGIIDLATKQMTLVPVTGGLGDVQAFTS